MIGQRRQIPPIGIAAQQLDHARHEHEAEQQPAQQPDARAPSEAQQQREKSGFQQERVPLVSHEVLPAIEQREIEHIEQKQAHAGQQIEDQQQRQPRSSPAHGLNGEIACAPPEHHRHQEETLRPDTAADGIDQFGQWQDAMAADQPLRLHAEGDEGRKVDQPKQAQEQE